MDRNSHLSQPMTFLSGSIFATGVPKRASRPNSRQPIVVAGLNDIDVLSLLGTELPHFFWQAIFMPRKFVLLLLAGSFATMLCACAAPRIAGGEVGGVVPLAGMTQEQALRMAQGHCAAFGHVARPLAVRSEEGGKLVFECV
jgi:hypothetical protein